MTLLKECATGAIAIFIFIAAFGLAWGGDAVVVMRLGLMGAALPFAIGAAIQHRVIFATVQARIEQLFNRDLNGSGVVGDVVTDRRALPRPRAEIVEPERVRLIPSFIRAGATSSTPATVTDEHGDAIARVVPVARPMRLIDGVREDDLTFFILHLNTYGHARGGWMGKSLPSGARVNSDLHAQLIDCVVKIGGIEGRGKGNAGRLVLTPDEIAQRIGLTLPVAPVDVSLPVSA